MKLFFLILLILPCYATSAQHTTEYKLILFIDDKLGYGSDISNFKIRYLQKEIDVQYDLASISYDFSDSDKIEMFQSGKVECVFDYYDAKQWERINFTIQLDGKEFSAGYLIIRIYTKTKKNQKRFFFGNKTFIYEYENSDAYHSLPRKKKNRACWGIFG